MDRGQKCFLEMLAFVAVLIIALGSSGCNGGGGSSSSNSGNTDSDLIWSIASTTLYDDFSNGEISSEYWKEKLEGSGSGVRVEDESALATAVKLENEDRGRSRLKFTDSIQADALFQGFQVEVAFVDSSDGNNRIKIQGSPYNIATRQDDSDEGNITVGLSFYVSGEVEYYVDKCNDGGCEDYITIATDTLTTMANPLLGSHTLAIGFDGNNVLLKADGETALVQTTDEYPLGTNQWMGSSIEARTTTDTETANVTVRFDNVHIVSF
jgi:hypothetical protein